MIFFSVWILCLHGHSSIFLVSEWGWAYTAGGVSVWWLLSRAGSAVWSVRHPLGGVQLRRRRSTKTFFSVSHSCCHVLLSLRRRRRSSMEGCWDKHSWVRGGRSLALHRVIRTYEGNPSSAAAAAHNHTHHQLERNMFKEGIWILCLPTTFLQLKGEGGQSSALHCVVSTCDGTHSALMPIIMSHQTTTSEEYVWRGNMNLSSTYNFFSNDFHPWIIPKSFLNFKAFLFNPLTLNIVIDKFCN